ncbi:NAD(P)-binding protein [Cadophora sp. DSE1049]|nr:NAD(P)-binding protein [Cadophora sp. DSE1049]
MTSQFLTNLFSLEGKTAIVTGGTGGLGKAMTIALAQAGAIIVSIQLPKDPNSAALAEAVAGVGSKVTPFECDLASPQDLRRCYASIWEAGFAPDVLLNCAGIIRRDACEDAKDEDIDLLFNINLKAVYISVQEFGRRLLHLKQPGKIINISSVTAFQANINTSAYATTKGGIVQMTKAFSNEWASKGIQVNSIAPGFMRTPMTDGYAANPKYTEYLMTRVPIARWGQPEDLKGAVIFLASSASSFVTGTTLIVDGGFVGK